MTSVTVGTEDFRLALRSVAPHADPSPDLPQLHRVRLEVGPENLTVSATNRYTVGHGIVSIWNNADGELQPFDLTPTDIKEILALFHASKGSSDGQPDDTLLIEVDDHHTTTTDVSGLFPGKSLRLVKCPTQKNYPNIARLIQQAITRQADSTERLVTDGRLLGLFGKAAAAYDEPLVLDPSGSNAVILITCGESFVGMLMPIKETAEFEAKVSGWHTDWLERLGEAASAAGDASTSELDKIAPPSEAEAAADLLAHAATLIITTQFASASMLQRKARVGLAKAAQLLDRLEQLGVVGPADGSKSRDVLIRPENLAAAIEALRAADPDETDPPPA